MKSVSKQLLFIQLVVLGMLLLGTVFENEWLLNVVFGCTWVVVLIGFSLFFVNPELVFKKTYKQHGAHDALLILIIISFFALGWFATGFGLTIVRLALSGRKIQWEEEKKKEKKNKETPMEPWFSERTRKGPRPVPPRDYPDAT